MLDSTRYIKNEYLNELLTDYCKKTYGALGATLTYFPSDTDPEDITCYATFLGGGNTMISSSEIKTIALNRLTQVGIGVEGLKFAIDEEGKNILQLINPYTKSKGK